MATIQDIVLQVPWPRIAPLAGTPEENKLIELWKWGILAQIYARISVNDMKFGVPAITKDVERIWDKAIAWVEENQSGDGDIIDIFPFMLDQATERYNTSGAPDPDNKLQLDQEELAQELKVIEWWSQRAVYYTMWSKFLERSPASDSITKIRSYIEGKMLRDFGDEADNDPRFKIYTVLQTAKAILSGQLAIK